MTLDLLIPLRGRVRRLDVSLPEDVSADVVALLRELLTDDGVMHVAELDAERRRTCDLVFGGEQHGAYRRRRQGDAPA